MRTLLATLVALGTLLGHSGDGKACKLVFRPQLSLIAPANASTLSPTGSLFLRGVQVRDLAVVLRDYETGAVVPIDLEEAAPSLLRATPQRPLPAETRYRLTLSGTSTVGDHRRLVEHIDVVTGTASDVPPPAPKLSLTVELGWLSESSFGVYYSLVRDPIGERPGWLIYQDGRLVRWNRYPTHWLDRSKLAGCYTARTISASGELSPTSEPLCLGPQGQVVAPAPAAGRASGIEASTAGPELRQVHVVTVSPGAAAVVLPRGRVLVAAVIALVVFVALAFWRRREGGADDGDGDDAVE